jgi:hypothetical protein
MGSGCNASVVVGYLINNASIGTVDLYLTRDQELVNARDPCRWVVLFKPRLLLCLMGRETMRSCARV